MLPITTNVTIGFGTASGTLDLDGCNQEIRSLTTAGTGGGNTVQNTNLAPITLIVNDPINHTYAGKILGNIALTKKGVGKFTLSNAANTYNGGRRSTTAR